LRATILQRSEVIAAVEGQEPIDADREPWLAVTGYRSAMTFVRERTKDPNSIYNQGLIGSLRFMIVQHGLSRDPGIWRPGTVYLRDESKTK
jgi:hypothetical protein